MIRVHCIALAVVIASGSTVALGDATVKFTGSEASHSTMYIKDGLVRMAPSDQSASFSVFDSRANTVTHVNADREAYVVVDEAAIRERAERMQQAMEQMRQRMQDMPQQGQAPQGGTPSEPPPAPSVRKAGRSETVAGVRCRVYETYQGDNKVGEICVASDLGLSKADGRALSAMKAHMRQMADQMRNMMSSMPGAAAQPADPMDEVEGIPVKVAVIDPQTGNLKPMMELTAVETAALSKELFQIPAGYERMDPNTAPQR
jgi:hypothetical protein